MYPACPTYITKETQQVTSLTSGTVDADGELLEADFLALGDVREILAQVPRSAGLHGAFDCVTAYVCRGWVAVRVGFAPDVPAVVVW